MRRALEVEVAGNIGRPLTSLVGRSTTTPGSCASCRRSSSRMSRRSGRVCGADEPRADYLDRHGPFEAYAAKLRAFERQADDVAVVPRGSAACRRRASHRVRGRRPAPRRAADPRRAQPRERGGRHRGRPAIGVDDEAIARGLERSPASSTGSRRSRRSTASSTSTTRRRRTRPRRSVRWRRSPAAEARHPRRPRQGGAVRRARSRVRARRPRVPDRRGGTRARRGARKAGVHVRAFRTRSNDARSRRRRWPASAATSSSSRRPAPRSTSSRASSTAGRSSAASCRSSRVTRSRRADRGQLEQKLLILVTLGLVAFGLVMVFSATSASATLGRGRPDAVPREAGPLRRRGPRPARVPLAGRLPRVAAPRADPPGRRVRRVRRCARRRPVDQRRAPLVPLRPRQLPAGGAREAGGLRLGLRRARPSRPPHDDGRADEAGRPRGLRIRGRDRRSSPTSARRSRSSRWSRDPARLGRPAPPLRARCELRGRGGASSAIWMEPYRRERVFSFLDPWKDAEGAGFQNVQAIIGIGSGGVTGEGLGQGIQKVNFLPEAHTDMIFAVVGEELGLVGSALVIAAFAVFAWAGFRWRSRCRDPSGSGSRPGSRRSSAPRPRQPRRGPRARAAHRDPAAVRLVRRLVAARAALRGRGAP